MPITVDITDQQSALKLSRPRLRQVVQRTLLHERLAEAEISLAFVGDAAMHLLNRRHLDHDYPTDVLSFLLSSPGASPLEGEIVISTETAIRQAEEFGWSPADEVTLYVVHGLLHLCGYDDHVPQDREAMRRRERDILQIWGLTPHYPE